jgi:hypothetical protein
MFRRSSARTGRDRDIECAVAVKPLWFDDEKEPSAIIVAIDQYAEAATGNRDFFLNKPPGLGGARQGDVP